MTDATTNKFAILVMIGWALCALAGCAPNFTVDRGAGVVAPGDSGGAGFAGSGTGGDPGAGSGGQSGAGEVDAEPASPPPMACGAIAAWVANGTYQEGTKVAAGRPTHIFECRPWPNSGWCPFVAYEPAKPDGPWADAWTDDGACP